MKFSEYTTKNIDTVLKDLKTSEAGLSEKEAATRLETFGSNEIKAKETGMFDIFLRQVRSPFVYLLLIASLIAFLIGEKIDSTVILVFVFINVFLGFFQEARAGKAVALLKKYLISKVRVLRDGKVKIIDKKFLVPGDIVLLEAGSIIPADLRILRANNFLIDESVLSGESISVSKISEPLSKETNEIFEAKNIVFAGTSVISGEARGVVVGTGKDMVLGEITKLVSGIKRESVYEKNLFKFSQLVLKIVIVTVVFVFLANLILNGKTNFFDFLIFCIALIVSILPEALPLVVTFSLSEGALKLAKKKVVVKRLAALEDLGNIEVLCTDKTGTITENKLSMEDVFAENKEKCLLYGLLSSPYIKEEIESVKNPFDTALFGKASSQIRQSLKKIKAISEMPFETSRLRNSVLLENLKGDRILIVRGAPEVILKLSSNLENGLDIKETKRLVEKEGQEGKRVLAVAFKNFKGDDYSEEDEKDLTFLGYFTFKDPLKKTAKEAIRLARKLGVQIKIITGDSSEVAGQIGKEVELIDDPTKVILGEILDSLPEEKFRKACNEYSVFARVSPVTKYKIVKTLQEKYEVGFLGEGINDAPALKASNLAIAVESAVDVSREISDIVLLKRDLKVIVNGIKNGRNIFSNINKYIKCTIASNFGNFYSIAGISLFIPFLPMLPIQILLVNLLSDFPLIAVASDKVDVEELKKPKLYQLHSFIPLIVLLASVSTVFDFTFFIIFHKVDPSLLQTLWFVESILTEIFLIFSIRTSRVFFKTKRPSSLLILISIITVIVTITLPFTNFGHQDFHFVSPSISYLSIVLFLIIGYFLTSETVKLLYFRHRNNHFAKIK